MKTLLVPRVYQPDSFAQLLERQLNLTPGIEAGRLDAEQVANLALLTVAQASAYAGTARLVALMRSLPVPSEELRTSGSSCGPRPTIRSCCPATSATSCCAPWTVTVPRWPTSSYT